MSVIRASERRQGVPRRSVLGSLAALFTCPLFEACMLGSRGPSDVAQGKYYSSGHPKYDAFFLELYELQVRMGQAPIEHAQSGNALAKDLGLAEDLPDEVLMSELHERAVALRDAGTRLLLLVRSEAGDPVPPDDIAHASSASFLVDGKPNDKSVLALTRACEKFANTLLIFRRALTKDQTVLESLGVKAIELDGGVDATFAPEGISKADEVDQNLADAQKIITLMHARAGELLKTSTQQLSALVAATNTDDGRLLRSTEKRPEDDHPPEDDEEPKQKKTKPSTKRSSSRKARPRPKRRSSPKPTTPKQPASGTEFEP